MDHTVLPAIVADLAGLLSKLEVAGYHAAASEYSQSFGNYLVKLVGEERWFWITRDRGQYSVGGPPKEELESAGLWRTFDDKAQFERDLLTWLSRG